jgi:hypothetical protein
MNGSNYVPKNGIEFPNVIRLRSYPIFGFGGEMEGSGYRICCDHRLAGVLPRITPGDRARMLIKITSGVRRAKSEQTAGLFARSVLDEYYGGKDVKIEIID